MSERKKLVVDLDGTITVRSTNEIRPGADRLIQELSDRGDLVLWTSAGRGRLESFLAAHQDLAGVFSQVISRNDWLDEDGNPNLPADFHPGDRDLRDKAADILLGYEGGKLPTLIGAEVVIDDIAPCMQDAAQKFGFKAIDAGSKTDDPTVDAWVARVLAELDE